jgi:hypothetical protein
LEYFNPTYYTKVYRQFKAIDPTAYREIIRFYEKEEDKILRLDFDEFFELLVAYVDALFEIGAYRKHLLLVDVVIEKSITHNVTIYKEEDIYRKMLFRKAASFYNTHEYIKATYILTELIKINPDDPAYAMLYRKCRLKARPSLLNHARAASVFLFLMTALIIAMEVLFVRPWYELHINLVMNVRNSSFLLGCLVLMVGFSYNYYLANRDLRQLMEQYH